ncbi:MAG: LamG-like jellyroll fold domain-containing protein [Bacteroidota bacterium]|nr:LamG-like jellyroll fold domain-containing protein [Bacteroidota bacterium]
MSLKFKTTYLTLLTSLLLINFLPVKLNAQIPTNGLIGYYPFNGNANDESVNTNHGTISGATLVSDRFSNANKAYSFNGTSNYISLPNTYDFMPKTINMWFNASNANYSDWVSIITSDNPNLTKGLIAGMIKEINGNLKMQLSICNIRDTFDITLNTWHNINIYTGSDKSVKFYLDGKFISSHTHTSFLTSVDGLDDVIIGATRSAASRFFKGHIDDIRIYNRELTSTEVELIYNEGKCVKYISVTDTLIINMNLLSSEPLKHKNSIKVYPNPTSDQISIDCGDNYALIQNYKIKISNALGQTVFTNKISQQIFTIDLSTWSGKGLYLLYIIDSQDNIIDVRKIILN